MADEISTMRAAVIEQSINIEWLINAIISQNYFRQVHLQFVFEVLYDEYCSFGLKRRVLLKICPELKGAFENNLNRINTIRNYFAHCAPNVVDFQDPMRPVYAPDQRKGFGESIDFVAMHKEFVELEKSVVSRLVDIYKGKGGHLVPATPSSGSPNRAP